MTYKNVGVPALALCIVAAVVFPLPSWALDLFIVANLGVSLVLFSLVLIATDRIRLQGFGSVMVISSLIRVALALSISRSIMTGQNGGSIVQGVGLAATSAGSATGVTVLILLALIDLVVVSAGVVRVAEVLARFALDAMPGHQMAIDSAIAAGHMGNDEAAAAREKLASECTFYGTMDGASRFLRGDIIATLCIVAITPIAAWAHHIGDGSLDATSYVSAMVGHGISILFPTLIVGSAGALTIARANERGAVGAQIAEGVLHRPETLALGAVALMLMACVIPTGRVFPMLFGLFALVVVFVLVKRNTMNVEDTVDIGHSTPAIQGIRIEIGYGLVHMVQVDGVEQRFAQLRERVARQTGISMAPFVIVDNPELPADQFNILWCGHSLAKCMLHSKRLLALGVSFEQIDGAIRAQMGDVEFGAWIGEEQVAEVVREDIKVFTAVDAFFFVLEDRLRSSVAECFGFEDAHVIMTEVGETHPATTKAVVSAGRDAAVLCRIWRDLLEARVGLHDPAAIVQAVAELPLDLCAEELTERVRRCIRRIICDVAAPDGELLAVTLSSDDAETLRQNIREMRPDSFGLGDGWQSKLRAWGRETYRMEHPICILIEADLRPIVQRLLVESGQPLMALSLEELGPGYSVRRVSAVIDADGETGQYAPALYEEGVS